MSNQDLCNVTVSEQDPIIIIVPEQDLSSITVSEQDHNITVFEQKDHSNGQCHSDKGRSR